MSDKTKRGEWRKHYTPEPGVVRWTAEPAGKQGRRPLELTEEERKARKAEQNRAFRQKGKAVRQAALAAGTLTVKSPGPRRMALEGRVFGELTVVAYEDTVGPPGGRKARWKVRCACGVELVLRTDQMLAKYGRKHCGHAWGKTFSPTEPEPGDRPKRGGSGLLNPPGRERKARAKAHRVAPELTPAEMAEMELQAAEKVKRREWQRENEARTRRGERQLPAERKEMDQAGWLRLLGTMRRSGARWSELEQELETAAAYGVTRAMVEEMGR